MKLSNKCGICGTIIKNGSYCRACGRANLLARAAPKKLIRARYAGSCPMCAKPILIGDPIRWAPGARATHEACRVVGAGPEEWKKSAHDRAVEDAARVAAEREEMHPSTTPADSWKKFAPQRLRIG